jgi:glucose dehydrogenase
MTMRNHSFRAALLTGGMLVAWPVMAADVTPERLVNADKEPGNWLMNHRTYDSQRYSPLDKINRRAARHPTPQPLAKVPPVSM